MYPNKSLSYVVKQECWWISVHIGKHAMSQYFAEVNIKIFD